MTGIVRTREIDVTVEQFQRWRAGELIQVAMPHLTLDEREFIKTGIVQEEWDKMFAHLDD